MTKENAGKKKTPGGCADDELVGGQNCAAGLAPPPPDKGGVSQYNHFPLSNPSMRARAGTVFLAAAKSMHGARAARAHGFP